jgi:hypothetical protein
MQSEKIDIARNLTLHIRHLLNDVGPNGRVLHIAHSAGAIITYLAAKYHLTNEEKKRIDVITFGGGHSITKKYFPGRLVNYYAQNDPLVSVDLRAGRLSKKATKMTKSMVSWFWGHNKGNGHKQNNTILSTGIVQSNIILSESISNYCNRSHIVITNKSLPVTHTNTATATLINAVVPITVHVDEGNEVYDHKHNTSFIFLKGIAQNPLRDHSMDGPTYAAALRMEAKKLHKQLYDLIEYEARNASVVRYMRKSCSKITGLHHFWKYAHKNVTTTVSSVSLIHVPLKKSFDALYAFAMYDIPLENLVFISIRL